jgi:hypothetical protein
MPATNARQSVSVEPRTAAEVTPHARGRFYLDALRTLCKSLLMLVSSILLLAAYSVPEDQGPAQPSKQVGRQKAEFVFDRHCIKTINPREGFELHVPLNGAGEPVDAESFSTGTLDFKVKTNCATVQVRPPTVRKHTSIDVMRKETCSDFGR